MPDALVGAAPAAAKKGQFVFSFRNGGPQVNELIAGKERAELYFMAHPSTPSAMRRPGLSRRAGNWIVLLGPNVRDGICGRGRTVEAALRAFDANYVAALRASNGHVSAGVRAPVQAGLR